VIETTKKHQPTKYEKLEAHSKHILDDFIRLRERYAMLDPMLFNEEVVKNWGQKQGGRGFKILVDSLVLSCAQDIAKICFDSDTRSPSIISMMDSLEEPNIAQHFRKKYSLPYLTLIKTDDLSVKEFHDKNKERRAEEALQQFDSLVIEIKQRWNDIETNQSMLAFQKIRDKITAHSELMYCHENESYNHFDMTQLHLKWGDFKKALEDIQKIIELIGNIFRCSSFAWETLDSQLETAAQGFWCSSL
jgi:hypothetical protein